MSATCWDARFGVQRSKTKGWLLCARERVPARPGVQPAASCQAAPPLHATLPPLNSESPTSSPPPPPFPPLRQSTFCFMFEFWPSLQLEALTDDATLIAKLTSSIVKPSCARLLGDTRICYVHGRGACRAPCACCACCALACPPSIMPTLAAAAAGRRLPRQGPAGAAGSGAGVAAGPAGCQLWAAPR